MARGMLLPFMRHVAVDLVTAVFAVHKAGAAFLILDPTYPAQRLLNMMQQAKPKAWIAIAETGAVPTSLQDYLQQNIDCQLRLPSEQLANYPTHPPAVTVEPDDLAYIAFTSGTTGKPRTIVGTHRPLAHFWQWQQRTFELTAADQFSLLSGLAHDPLLRDLFTPLFVGGTLHIPDETTLYSTEKIAAWMADHQITVTHLTPALGQILTTSATPIPTLRYAFFGGEALSAAVVDQMHTIAPQATCVNFYGTTETPQAMGYFVVERPLSKTVAPLGQGIEGAQLLVLASDLQLACVGEMGQIGVRTPYLAQGYLQEAELTAAKFISNPFVTNAPVHDRIYLTGDYGRFLPNGDVEFAGRGDGQLNIRGYRVELSEIETALTKQPQIQRAIVQLRQEQLIAYLVSDTETFAEERLRESLQAELPNYMIPNAFVLLDEIPLTPNGKVDFKALPSPELQSETAVLVPPSTPTEATLLSIWQDLLNLEKIGVTDNFFALGGHSLLGTQLISRIRQQLNVDLPLQTLFTVPTIRALADVVTSASRTTSSRPQPLPPQVDYPLSFAQQRLWFLHQLEKENRGYTIGTAVALKGRLHIKALTQSINAIVARHDSLRTQFVMLNEQPRQFIRPQKPFTIAVEEVAPTTDIVALVDAYQQKPFDLERDALLRIKLLRVAPEEHILLLNMHHIIADGWSATIFMRELRQAYAAFLADEDWQPTPLPIQYHDFARWQRQWLTGELLDKQTTYWSQQLAGELPVIDLPMDAQRPPQQTFTGEKHTLPLNAGLSQALRQLSQAQNTTLFMTMLAGFKLWLHRLTKLTDLVVGTPIANRNQQETEALIGFFANTLVLRTSLAADDTFVELLQAVRETTLGAYAHQDLPFERLVELFQPERDLSRPPLFQLFFNMINMADYGKFELPNLETERVENGRIVSKFDLTMYVLDDGKALNLELVYNRDLFSAERMTTWLAQYVTLLEQVVVQPNQSLNQFSLQTSPNLLPDPTVPLHAESCPLVHQRLTEMAKAQPEQLALVSENAEWTYAKLEANSNQLAHYLLNSGISKGDLVAVAATRSPELVASLLAIHKAGAAFTILDMAYPPSRLVQYLEQAQPVAWLQLAEGLPHELRDYLATQAFKCQANVLSLDLTQLPTTLPAIHVDLDDLAYIAFTSGTTGQPRAIRGTHRPLAHFGQWHRSTFGLSASDHFTMLSGLAHDPLLRDIFTPLQVGGTLYIPNGEALLTPNYVANWMAKHEISVTHLTPALSQIITLSEQSLPMLRHAFFGGDRLTQQVVTRFQNCAPHARCVNFYGTTETPQAIAYHVIEAELNTAVSPIGKGIDDVQLLILTDTLQLAGVGELGQIGVRTPYLADGYLDEALTATKFVPNPLCSDATDRIYLTGDYGRYLPDGSVEFVGRMDGQVNVRGYRIELSEIEAVLTAHPQVTQAVVRLHEEQLVAYVVGETAVADTLNHYSQQHFPSYMEPSLFIPIEQLPLTPNGKVDYAQLPTPSSQSEWETMTLPRTATEIELVSIWQDLLQQSGEIGIEQDFFRLGWTFIASNAVVVSCADDF